MAPKKKGAKAKAEPAAEATTALPATEISEPPKDQAQPASGDLSKDEKLESKDETLENKDETLETKDETLETKGETLESKDEALETKDEALETKDAPQDQANAISSTEPPAAPQIAAKSKKRKQAIEPESSSKTRRTGRSSKPELSQQQLLNYLLSKDAEELLRSDDEKKALQERGDIRTYSSSIMSPFEELMCAMILARPISHVLGLRTIRTVLNEPYNFSSAQNVKDAGEEKRHQALFDARTQHKGKTADQLGQVADVVLEKFSSADDKEGTALGKALSDNDNDLDEVLKSLKESINGLGDKGLDIFLRRVQWLSDWKEGFPYADGVSMDGLRNVGLTQDVDELVETINKHWSSLNTKHLAGDDAAAKKRRALVIILERATGAHLDNKISEVQQEAAKA